MRKPLVVVGVAAVLLGTGTIVATRAVAQESPGFPDVPAFGLPGFPAFGDDSDQAGSDQAGSDQDGADQTGSSDPWAGDPADDSWDGDPAADGSSLDDSTDGAGDAAGDGRPTDGSAAQRPGTGQAGSADDAAHPAPARPARPRPAAAQRPAAVSRPGSGAQRGFAQQPATASLLAASRRDVSAADISASPYAPVQQQVLILINANRRAHGCGEVSLDRRLIDAANGHAADMARNDYFAHESLDGEGAGDRVTDAGYSWKRYGENIARGVDSAYAVVDGWMHSPEHRHNILDCRLDQMGVGLAISGDRTTYWVQDFATPQ